ncbi:MULTISPECIES: FadR/GntR family transcriptional regulator [Psychrilyobacter]|uniref:FCD domain-containing protein n=1 Tax=Psychrilyobacter piezotolerans TaxID=2293438 RepID=A0ABX9KER0_9FUSO|nr:MULTISPECIES: FCD domain-containing protein [Psychrilyobacter]MCS5421314.1 FCD domain-containing protein [Psychrilyobacter sp. S5]NDI78336.1 FadR family transcriptional regulator [Psychrilyobacter piezotolerans]RDE59683.1 FadR family transcriptional regulator [Psychrilyobacter sp. S5]REI40059.1 FCD domain-containing protein [Psychrilyobacter piezotolerans]
MEERKFHKLIEHIKKEIKSGNLKNGSQIYPERTLAENLNIGRSSVREGIKILEIIGLIESKRGGGNYITNDFKNMLCNPLSLAFELQKGKIRDVIELRKMLELSNAEFMIKRVTLEEIQQVEKIYEKMLNCNDIERLADLDRDFHLLMMSFSKNILLTTIISAISELLEESIIASRDMVLEKFGKEKIDFDHKKILESLKNRDEEGLKNSLRLHFDNIDKSLPNLD